MNRQEMFTQELKELLKKYKATLTMETENPNSWPEFQRERMIVEFDWVEGELHDTDVVLGSYFDGGENE